MLSWRYWSCIQDVHLIEITEFPIHVFWKILIPHSRFSRNHKTDPQDCSGLVFSNIFKLLTIQDSDVSKQIIFELDIFQHRLTSVVRTLSSGLRTEAINLNLVWEKMEAPPWTRGVHLFVQQSVLCHAQALGFKARSSVCWCATFFRPFHCKTTNGGW